MTDRRDVAALCQIGLVGALLGFLQQFVGALVRVNFLHQQIGSAGSILLRDLPALVRQDHPPGADAGEQQQGREGLDEYLPC